MSDRRLVFGGGFLALVALAALAAPWLGLRDPRAQPDGLVLRDLPPLSRVDAILLADGRVRYAEALRIVDGGAVEYRRGSSWSRLEASELAGFGEQDWHRRPLYLLGTDGFGRDLASRLVHGARISLLVGSSAALIAMAVGVGIGLTSGLSGGLVDSILMRATDAVLSVPRLFLALMLVALYGASMMTTVLVLAATSWMVAARLVRGELLSARRRDYVTAARAIGVPGPRLGLVHLLPAAMVPLSVESTLVVGDTILLETALSFLGLGVPAPTPSWGNMIADGRTSLLDAWWIATLPGLAIVATVVALNAVGQTARDRMSFRPDRHRRPSETRRDGASRGGPGPRRGLGPALVPASGRVACLILTGGLALGPLLAESPVQLEVRRETEGAEFIVRNEADHPIEVTIELIERRNVSSDRPDPTTLTVPAASERTLLALGRADPLNPWSFRYRWSWRESRTTDSETAAVAEDEGQLYALPFPDGVTFDRIDTTAEDLALPQLHAIEWITPAGTPIRAARGGTVAAVDHDETGQLRVLHDDGTIAIYRPLDRIRVMLGDPVRVGEPLGVVREARGSRASHLRFHVFRPQAEGRVAAVSVRFEPAATDPSDAEDR